MNILVIGCDQVGASLIRDLERIGHDISLIERDPEQLKRLDAFDDYRFGGTALVGDPTDPDVLRRGGVVRGVAGAILGAILYRILMVLALKNSASPSNMKLVSAVIVALAISYPALAGWVWLRRRKRAAARGGKGGAEQC